MADELDAVLLDKIDQGRRAALRKLVLGAAYAVPVVASFAMAGQSTPAMAEPNQPVAVPTLTDWSVPVFGAVLGAAAVTAAVKKSSET
jgi:hypothetical protein